MRPRNLLLIFAIFIFVLSFYFVFERVYMPKKEAKEERKNNVFSFDLDEEIDEIVIARKGVEIVLKKEEGKKERWVITSPIKSDADSAEVISYLAKGLDAERQKEIGSEDVTESDLSVFGLKKPRFSLTLKMKGESQTLNIGSLTPSEDFVYAKKSGDDTIFTVKKSVFTDLDIDLIQLRERSLVAFPMSVTREFKVERGGKVVRVNRTALGSWKIVEPIEFSADKEVVKEILNFIYDSKAQRYIDEESPDPGKYGLDNPVITFTAVDKGGAISVLKIGDEDKEGNYYAKLEGLPWVFTVKETVKNKLTLSAESVMEKVILDYVVADVSGFTVTTGKDKIECRRTADKGWEIVKPEKTFADKAAVDNLLWEFKDLRFIDVVEKPAANLAKYGLDRPVVVLNVAYSKEGEEKSVKKKVMIGKVEGETGYGYCEGISKGQEFVFSFPAERIENLTPTFFDLKDKSLLRFERDDVENLKIVWGSENYEFQKKRGKWKVISPEDKDVESDDVKYLLGTVKDLAYFSVLSPDDDRKRVFGLNDTKKEIIIKGGDGEEMGEIRFGKVNEEDGYVSAASSALKGVYGVKSDVVEELGSEIEDLMK